MENFTYFQTANGPDEKPEPVDSRQFLLWRQKDGRITVDWYMDKGNLSENGILYS